MTTEAFNALVAQDIQALMREPSQEDYVTTLASYLGADPALLRCLVHCERCPITNHFLTDLRQAEESLKQYEQDQRKEPLCQR